MAAAPRWFGKFVNRLLRFAKKWTPYIYWSLMRIPSGLFRSPAVIWTFFTTNIWYLKISDDETYLPIIKIVEVKSVFFFKDWPLTFVNAETFKRPQLFHPNTETVVKRGFCVFWWWSQSEVLPCLEETAEKFKRLKRPVKTR